MSGGKIISEGAVNQQKSDDAKRDQLNQLVEMVYQELHQIAHFHRHAEKFNLTLQTTALVHEAYLKLAQSNAVEMPGDVVHLKALTSRVIRHVLVDYARRRNADKRDIGLEYRPTTGKSDVEPPLDVDILDLDAALHRLAQRSNRLEQIVEYRFFGGLSVEETAQVMELSNRTVERDWRNARAYLLHFLESPGLPS